MLYSPAIFYFAINLCDWRLLPSNSVPHYNCTMSEFLQVKVSRDGKDLGTCAAQEAVRLLLDGTLKESDFYWHEGMTKWEPLSMLRASEDRKFWAECAQQAKQEQFRKGMEGDAEAQYNLGMCSNDYVEAAKWYRKAADQGVAEAQYKLGLMYSNGDGLPKDLGEAVKWYRKAAELGLTKAQYSLGAAYEEGCGVLKDPLEAYAWFNIVAVSDRDARKKREELGKILTPEQRILAQQRSTELHKEIEAKLAAKKAGK